MQEQDYNKIEAVQSENLTPAPISPQANTSIEPVIETFVKYYQETDKRLLKQLNAGMMLSEASGDDTKHMLDSIITLFMYTLNTKTDDINQMRNITCATGCINELLKTIDFDVLELTDIKELVVKLLGYVIKLHKNIDTYKI